MTRFFPPPTVKLANQNPFPDSESAREPYRRSGERCNVYLVIELPRGRGARLTMTVMGYRRQRRVSWDGYFVEGHGERTAQDLLGKAGSRDSAEEELREHVCCLGDGRHRKAETLEGRKW